MPDAQKDKPAGGPLKITGEQIECSQIEGFSLVPIVNTRCRFDVDAKGHVSKPSEDPKPVTTLPVKPGMDPKITVSTVKGSSLMLLTVSAGKGEGTARIAKLLENAPSDVGPNRNQSRIKGEQIWCVVTRKIAPNERTAEKKDAEVEEAEDKTESVRCSFYFDKKGKVTAPKPVFIKNR